MFLLQISLHGIRVFSKMVPWKIIMKVIFPYFLNYRYSENVIKITPREFWFHAFLISCNYINCKLYFKPNTAVTRGLDSQAHKK